MADRWRHNTSVDQAKRRLRKYSPRQQQGGWGGGVEGRLTVVKSRVAVDQVRVEVTLVVMDMKTIGLNMLKC